MYKRRVWLFLFFSVCIGIPYNRHVFAHDKCWSVKAIVEKSEIIAIVTVNKLQRSHDFINIGFSVGETYKGDTDRLNSFIMPTVPKGTFRSPKMLSFLIGKRYLFF